LPTCGKCQQEYDEVKVYVIEQNKYIAYIDDEGDIRGIDWTESEVIESSEQSAELQCPFCENIVAHWLRADDPTMTVTEFVEHHLCGEDNEG